MFNVKSLIAFVSVMTLVFVVVWLWKNNYTIVRKPLFPEGFDPELKGVRASETNVELNEEHGVVPQNVTTKSGQNDRLTSSDLLPSENIEKNWSSIVSVPKDKD